MPQIKRILVPTDFSSTSDLAVKYAVEIAARHGASLLLLHVLEDPSHTAVYPDAYFAELPTLRKDMRDEAERRLRELAAWCRTLDVDAAIDVVDGRPPQAIAREAAHRGTDLIVMGTHGRSGIAHLVLGSVAERVVRSAPCPVLTVRDTARVADAIAAESETRLPAPFPA